MAWRLMVSDPIGPLRSVAIEQALLESRADGGGDTVHIYRRDRETISLGRSQGTDALHMDAVQRDGVSVVRRSSGGSAILTGPEQLILSIVSDRDRFGSRQGTFDTMCAIIVDALGRMGLDAEHKPPNDVLIAGRKVSGSARRDLRGAMITHGTIVLELSDDAVERYIRPKERTSPRSYDGVAGLRDHVPGLTVDSVREELIHSLHAALGVMTPTPLTERERARVETLMNEGFGRP